VAGKAKQYDFHGSYSKKKDAAEKERETGGFVRERKVEGKPRYFVLSERKPQS